MNAPSEAGHQALQGPPEKRKKKVKEMETQKKREWEKSMTVENT